MTNTQNGVCPICLKKAEMKKLKDKSQKIAKYKCTECDAELLKAKK